MILDAFRLDDKVALVTGASAGLGAAIAGGWQRPARTWSLRTATRVRLMRRAHKSRARDWSLSLSLANLAQQNIERKLI